MAPNLSLSQHDQIRDMILSNPLTDVEIASVAGCTTRSIRTIRANLRCFGTSKAPANRVGRPRSITPPMLRALYDRLIEKPHMYQDEMVVFLWDEFGILVTTYSISRALRESGLVQENRASHCTRTKRRAARPLPPQPLRVSLVPSGVHRRVCM
jgi:transposase